MVQFFVQAEVKESRNCNQILTCRHWQWLVITKEGFRISKMFIEKPSRGFGGCFKRCFNDIELYLAGALSR